MLFDKSLDNSFVLKTLYNLKLKRVAEYQTTKDTYSSNQSKNALLIREDMQNSSIDCSNNAN